MLFDFCTLTVLQMWKSYRHAQIGWLSTSDQVSSSRVQAFANGSPDIRMHTFWQDTPGDLLPSDLLCLVPGKQQQQSLGTIFGKACKA